MKTLLVIVGAVIGYKISEIRNKKYIIFLNEEYVKVLNGGLFPTVKNEATLFTYQEATLIKRILGNDTIIEQV